MCGEFHGSVGTKIDEIINQSVYASGYAYAHTATGLLTRPTFARWRHLPNVANNRGKTTHVILAGDSTTNGYSATADVAGLG